METLAQIYAKYQSHGRDGYGDKGTIHSYIEPYMSLLEPVRAKARFVVEIGILNGTSLLMWEEYFAQATVYGIDKHLFPIDRHDLRPLIAAGHQIRIFDATEAAEVKNHFGGTKFDVVIDDASHQFEQQVQLYQNFKPYLTPGAIYIIEDIQDIDAHRAEFEQLDPTKQIDILDLRSVKGRYDDVLVVLRDKP